MANERLHLIHLHSETVKVPSGSTADLRYGEIAVQYAASDPALYIKKSDDTFAKFVPNIDISGATTGSGNVITGISVSNNTVTAAKGNAVQTATGDTLISATVSGGTKVVISATTALSQSVVESHHDNRDVLDGISSGDVANWNEAYTSAHTHTNKALLDTYTQTETDLADAVTKKHEHSNKQVLDGITSGKVSNWDSAYTNMLSGITHGTDSAFVTTTIGTKSGKKQSVGVAVTTAATSGATSEVNGLATAYETKQYIDSKVTGATITGDGIVIGGAMSVSHKTYTEPSDTDTKTLTHGGSFTGITAISEDGYGHVTGATATTFTMPSETQLSTGSSGTGNVVTGITVSNHQVTKVMGYAVTSASGDDYISANTNNGALSVSLKSVVGSGNDLGNVSTTGSVADAKAVKEYVDAQVTSSVNYCGATSTLPSTSQTGDLYIASAQIAVPAASSASGSATTAETGDYLICREAGKWDVIEKNLTGAVTTNTTLTTNRLVVGNGTKTVKLAPASGSTTQGIYIKANGEIALTNEIHDSATTLDGHYTPSSSTTKSATTNYAIAGLEMDAKGHVTGVIDSAHKVEKDVPSNAVFTDTKVTSVDNHYSPASSTTKSATANYAIAGLEMDAKGHVTGVINSTYSVAKSVPSNAVFTDYSGTTETLHYTPSTTSSTVGDADGFIKQIKLDSKNHVIEVTTGTPASTVVVDCASTITTASTTLGTIDGNAITAKIGVTNSGATIPMSASTATTLATVGGVNITAKTSMNKLSIAGAAANAGTAEFDGKSDVTITVLDCGEY